MGVTGCRPRPPWTRQQSVRSIFRLLYPQIAQFLRRDLVCRSFHESLQLCILRIPCNGPSVGTQSESDQAGPSAQCTTGQSHSPYRYPGVADGDWGASACAVGAAPNAQRAHSSGPLGCTTAPLRSVSVRSPPWLLGSTPAVRRANRWLSHVPRPRAAAKETTGLNARLLLPLRCTFNS